MRVLYSFGNIKISLLLKYFPHKFHNIVLDLYDYIYIYIHTINIDIFYRDLQNA